MSAWAACRTPVTRPTCNGRRGTRCSPGLGAWNVARDRTLWRRILQVSSVLDVSEDKLGLLWIAGAPGTGKSAAAWGLYRRLAEQGVRVAYVDIDQLGMLYPAPAEDPERHRLKEDALNALLPGYLAHRAQVVIVSGVVDPVRGPRPSLSGASDLTLVVLAQEPGDLRERLLARGWELGDADAAVAENDLLQGAEFPDRVIDTAGLDVSATVDQLLPAVRLRHDAPREPGRLRGSAADLNIVGITGTRAVGSSTVGFGFVSRRWRSGLSTAFVDPEQLSFISDCDSIDDLAARQLATMHELMASRGAGLFVVSGRPTVVNPLTLGTAAPAASHLIVRLRADRDTVQGHVRERALGSGARLAGDDLLGADVPQQARVVAKSVEDQRMLDAAAPENEHVLDATGRSPDELVDGLDLLATDRAAGQ